MEFCAIAEYSPLRAHAARNRHVGCGLKEVMRRHGELGRRLGQRLRRLRPKADLQPLIASLQCGPSEPPFAASAKSNLRPTHGSRDGALVRSCCTKVNFEDTVVSKRSFSPGSHAPNNIPACIGHLTSTIGLEDTYGPQAKRKCETSRPSGLTDVEVPVSDRPV